MPARLGGPIGCARPAGLARAKPTSGGPGEWRANKSSAKTTARMGRRVAEGPRSRRRTRLKQQAGARSSWARGLVLVAQVALVAGAALADRAPARQEILPGALLPKFGLVRGLKFNPGAGRAVAVFLGVPYAAPPTGPLRFMPPGAVRPGQQRQPAGGASEQCRLLPSGTGAPVRPFARFGAECVRLASWLEPRPGPTDFQRQSEDCLNLNLFVPYEPARLVAREPSPSGSGRPPADVEERAASQAELAEAGRRDQAGDKWGGPPANLEGALERPPAGDSTNSKPISPNESAQGECWCARGDTFRGGQRGEMESADRGADLSARPRVRAPGCACVPLICDLGIAHQFAADRCI